MNSSTNDAPQCATFVASLSDVGRVRSVNEDGCNSLVRADGTRLLVVADGMGGHRGGAVASREAIAAIGASFLSAADAASPPLDTSEASTLLRRAITEANARIYSLSRQDPELSGMGTTVVALLLDPACRATVAHVGDSRCYRLRDRRLEPLTQDHSVVAEMLQRGVLTPEEAAYHPRRNEILRSVGVLRDVEVEVAPVDVALGDWFLLCSDGLCGVVSDAEIEEVLVATTSPEDAVAALVDLANDCGGPDNVTVQILAIEAAKAGARPVEERPDRGIAAPSAAPAGPPAAPPPAGSTNGAGNGTADARRRGGDANASTALDEAAPGARSGAGVSVAVALAFFAALAWWLARHH
jgi:PPM family protein phosphatase